MEVHQKHVTTIRMHDAKGCDIKLVKDGGFYQLQLCSPTSTVTISLGLGEVRKLCQELVQLDAEECCKCSAATAAPEYRSIFFQTPVRSFQETMAKVFARMAREMICEPACEK
jgi:hypothetical protein